MEKRPSGGEVKIFKNRSLEHDHRYWQNVSIESSSSRDPVFHLFLQHIDEILRPFSHHTEDRAIFYTLRSFAVENYHSKTPHDEILLAVRSAVEEYTQIAFDSGDQ